MMREKLIGLRERRAQLIASADTQRAEVFALVERADQVATWVDRARAIVRQVRSNPVWIAAAVAFVVALRPRTAFKLVASGYSLWRGWRRIRATLDRLVPTPARARRAY